MLLSHVSPSLAFVNTAGIPNFALCSFIIKKSPSTSRFVLRRRHSPLTFPFLSLSLYHPDNSPSSPPSCSNTIGHTPHTPAYPNADHTVSIFSKYFGVISVPRIVSFPFASSSFPNHHCRTEEKALPPHSKHSTNSLSLSIPCSF